MSVTGREIRREVGRILRQNDADEYMAIVNTSGTDTDSITDSLRLLSTMHNSQTFMGRYVRESDGSAVAPAGDKSRALDLVNSTGVLNISPAFSGALAANDELELWKRDPDTVDAARDRALRQYCTRTRFVPFSWLANPDYLVDELSDATPTSWTGSSATATVTQKSGVERFSERVLRVLNTGANGYAGQTVNTPSGAASGGKDRTWFFHALVQAAVGSAVVVVYDLTASAALTQTAVTRTSWDGQAFNIISFTVVVPDTTEQVSVRLGAAGATDDTYWGPVCFYPVDAQEFTLPSRIANRSRVGVAYQSVATDWPEGDFIRMNMQPLISDVGGGVVQATFRAGIGRRPAFFEEYATYMPLQSSYDTQAVRATGDAATTDCPLEYAAWATVYELVGDAAEEQWLRVHARHGAKRRIKIVRERSAGVL